MYLIYVFGVVVVMIECEILEFCGKKKGVWLNLVYGRVALRSGSEVVRGTIMDSYASYHSSQF